MEAGPHCPLSVQARGGLGSRWCSLQEGPDPASNKQQRKQARHAGNSPHTHQDSLSVLDGWAGGQHTLLHHPAAHCPSLGLPSAAPTQNSFAGAPPSLVTHLTVAGDSQLP